jgi:hypothetical protein
MPKKINQQKIRKDIIMISVSLFSIVGGTVVFRSFASQKYDTTRAGEVPYSRLTSENTGSFTAYQVLTKDGLSYCFKNQGYVVQSNGIKKDLSFNNDKKRYCYTSELSGQDRIYLKNPDSNDSVLIF